ncbi:hypothetical protein MKW94_024422 [Papaver nudicaule]|uniref:N-acetyltransferase domain-containing protein n=1 Tax=Papaver nudicaule TaxID=74823 RepID=A0AA41RT10_PAPNU|nr:hypothetical protein [Papaver nudicaule]
MVDIRLATMKDIPGIKACDSPGFPEDSDDDFYFEDYLVSWPRLVYVAEDKRNGCILGCILAKMEVEGSERHGYISYLGFASIRHKVKRGRITKKLLTAVHNAMVRSDYVSVRVPQRDRAAIRLFTEKLGYQIKDVAPKLAYYDEDAYVMVKQLQGNRGAVCFPRGIYVRKLKGYVKKLLSFRRGCNYVRDCDSDDSYASE